MRRGISSQGKGATAHLPGRAGAGGVSRLSGVGAPSLGSGPARLHRPARAQVAIVSLLLVTSAAAWLLADSLMSGMDAGPGTDPGALGFFVTTWVVMMAAMMFPSFAPTVSAYAVISRGRRESAEAGAPPGSTLAFVSGYLAIWAGFGLVAYALFGIVRSLDLGVLAWDRQGPLLAGGVIGLAAAYQLSPVKNACLTRCRNPLGFVITSWRGGHLGALTMGFRNGAWCLGCCWGLMAALFAFGVMSLAWMAFFALLVAAEKLLPWGRATSLGIATVLLALAIGVARAPERVPGLTLPGSQQARMAMQHMSMGDSRGQEADGAMSGGN